MTKLIGFRLPVEMADSLLVGLAKERIGKQHIYTAFSELFLDYVVDNLSSNKKAFVRSIIQRAIFLQRESKRR